MTQFVLHRQTDRTRMLDRVRDFLSALGGDKAWAVEVKPYRRRRSDDQNRYLFGVVYKTVGEAIGADKDDLHEFFLGEWGGWETTEIFGKKRHTPIRRSSKLNSQEFSEYIEFIQRRCAEQGVFIPDPE